MAILKRQTQLARAGLIALSSGCTASGSAIQDGVVRRSEPGAGTGGAQAASSPNAGSTASVSSSAAASSDGVTLCSDGECLPTAPAAPGNCGDGVLTPDEACDDGNRSDGDGCAAHCLALDPGYSCSPPGTACHVVALCGDGIVASNELCDDGNELDADGCSARCKLEPGFQCEGQPSRCSPSVCGNHLREGAESCDDGNDVPLDGCSADCQAEPDCRAGACTSACGDGLVIDEECDDGNTLDGDGCSSTCRREAGFTCAQRPSCTEPGGCVLRVPTVYRDFSAAHPDFHCGGGSGRPSIAAHLNALSKPELLSGDPGCISSAASFAEWYTSGANSVTVPSSITLFPDGSGGYVNRYGPNGERWIDLNGGALDGNPVFLPIDAALSSDARSVATIAPEYTGDDTWHPESDFVPGAGSSHDFLFTTEVEYWFRFDVGFRAQLDFLGDDDVWVFVNGVLALDRGGLHVPERGLVPINAETATTYGLSAGNVYAIKVFHAERNPTGSSFKLTLTGFENTPSQCEPRCGDGIVSLGEECDDGMNDGGYGECEPGCKLGPRCGDHEVQAGEDCDDGNRIDGDGCGSGCRNVVLR